MHVSADYIVRHSDPLRLTATFHPIQETNCMRLTFMLWGVSPFGRNITVCGGHQGLLLAIEKLHGDVEHARYSLEIWGEGHTDVYPSEAQLRWLRGS